jgi:serine/threonine protein kinase
MSTLFGSDDAADAYVESFAAAGLEVGERLGTGHFSVVYAGTVNQLPVAIKVPTALSPDSDREARMLELVRGCPHAQRIVALPAPCPFLVTELLASAPRGLLDARLTVAALRAVLSCVVECLAEAHRRGIAHGDVKRENIIVAPDLRSAGLIDWAFACRITDRMNPMVGSRLSRSPEMLLNFAGFGCKADVWAVGVVILDVLTNRGLPWNASNTWMQLAEMTKVFGGAAVRRYADELGVTIKTVALEKFTEEPTATFEDFIVRDDLRDAELIGLMKVLLSLDYRQRPTAAEVQQHPFFAPR